MEILELPPPGAYALYKEVTEPPHSIERWSAWVLERAEQDE